MFKFVLLRAVQTTAQVFSTGDVPNPECCRDMIKDYRKEAERVWWQKGVDYSVKRRECSRIGKSYFSELDEFPLEEELRPVPAEVAATLDTLFNAHYDREELHMLFGRGDYEALIMQEKYACGIATALGELDPQYEAKANIHLRPRLGKGAPLPLLSKASMDAMWKVCCSDYYIIQIKTVSLAIMTVGVCAEICFSFIYGSSRSD